MKLSEIKAAVDAGWVIHYANDSYKVTRDNRGQFWVKHDRGGQIGLTWQDGVTLNGAEEDFYVGTKPFTVIGFYESTGQIFSHHVQANCAMGAFAVVASMDVDAMPLVALDGHVQEGQGLTFVSDELLDAQTILDLPDVFGGEPLLNGLPCSGVEAVKHEA